MYDASASQKSKNIGSSIKQTIDSGYILSNMLRLIIYFMSLKIILR